MDIVLKNSEITEQRFQMALSALMAKPLPVSLAWRLSDIQEYIDRRFKKYNEKRIELFKKFGAKEDSASGRLAFTEDNPAPAGLKAEIESLDNIEGRIQVDSKLTLPDKDATGKDIQYEAFILFGFKKFLTDRFSTIKEIEEEEEEAKQGA